MTTQGKPAGTNRIEADLAGITWSLEPDASVRQVWESSTDGGTTWTVAFDGRYVKK